MDGATGWYAVSVKPQHEFKAFRGLQQISGVETFLPTYKDKRIWSDRVKILDTPLFAGYVFARFEYPVLRVPVLRVAGVRTLVGFAGTPSPVPQTEIESIRTLVTSKFPLEPWPFLRAGHKVLIEHGPLRGVEGVVLERKDEWRMIVSVEMLQRSVAVVVDRSVLRRVGGTERATVGR